MTYAQKSIIGSGGYFPEDAQDVMAIMADGKWDLESIITQEFRLEGIAEAIQTVAVILLDDMRTRHLIQTAKQNIKKDLSNRKNLSI